MMNFPKSISRDVRDSFEYLLSDDWALLDTIYEEVFERGVLEVWKMESFAQYIADTDYMKDRLVPQERLENPVIVAALQDGYYLLDGHHRVFQKNAAGHSEINVFVIEILEKVVYPNPYWTKLDPCVLRTIEEHNGQAK